MHTLGLSKKLQPLILGVVVGVVLVVVGEREIGVSVLLTCVSGLGLGYRQPADLVTTRRGVGSDARLSAGASAEINRSGEPPSK